MEADSPRTILDLVHQFNFLIKPAIEGPNCIDRQICDGNCCYIRIDVPKVLAEFYIHHGWAKKEDFRRGDVFSFTIDVSYSKFRCNFFDVQLNGCGLHGTKYKPPQCWVYPTGLDPDQCNDKCKKASGWKIVDNNRVIQAKKCIEQYFDLCKKEALEENKESNINQRLANGLYEKMKKYAPAKIAGVVDTWDCFEPLFGDGMNVGIMTFCQDQKCPENYFGCHQLCDKTIKQLYELLREKLPRYIQKNGFKAEYTFIELKSQI